MAKLDEKAANAQLRKYSVKKQGWEKFFGSFILHPEKSRKCVAWDRIVIPALFFTCIFTPYEVAFITETPEEMKYHLSHPDARGILNRLIDAIFIADMFFQFFIMYPIMTKRGSIIWINCPLKIAWHYLTTWFVIDLVSILPFELLIFIFDKKGKNTSASAQEIVVGRLRFLRVVRCLRLLKMMRVFRASRIMERWQNDLSISQHKITMVKFMLVLIIAGHWMACLWGLVGLMEEGPITWVEEEKKKGFHLAIELYVAALHWSIMTLTSIGYGDIVGMTVPERVVGIIAMLFAGCLWANVIGGFSAAAASLDKRRLEFNTNMDELNQVMQEHNLPQKMRSRLRYFFYQKHDLGSTPVRLNHLLDQLSPDLCREVCMFVHRHWLDKVSLFQGTSDLFLVEVSSRMRPQVFAPEEHFGEIFILYILHSGVVSLKASMQILTTGRIWGKDFCLTNPILLENPVVFCFGFVGVLTLRKKQFFEAADMFPADKIIIRKQTTRIAVARGVLRYCAMKRHPNLYKSADLQSQKSDGDELGNVHNSESQKNDGSMCKKTSIRGHEVVEIIYTGLAKVAAVQAAWITELKSMNRIPLSVMESGRLRDGGSLYDCVSSKEIDKSLSLVEVEVGKSSKELTSGLNSIGLLAPSTKVPTEAELNSKVEALESKLYKLHSEFEDQKATLNKLLDVVTRLDTSIIKVNQSMAIYRS